VVALDQNPNRDLLVVGGGVAGLSCALALADAGLRVTVLEAAERLGGRASSAPDAVTGDEVDIGPHVLTSEHRHFMALLERLGTADRVQWQAQPLITLLERGRVQRMRACAWTPPLHVLPNLPRSLRSVSVADLLSNLRVAWLVVRMRPEQQLALDARDARSWLREMGVRPRFIEWFWATATLALLNVPLERCSAAALANLFRFLAVRSGYCFGFPREGLSSLYVPGCAAALKAKGCDVLTDATVLQLVANGARGIEARLADGRSVSAQAAVIAVPPQALARIAPQPLEAAAQRWAARFEPSPYVSTCLWFDRRLGTERFWARVAAPGDLNLDFYDKANIRGEPPGVPSVIAANSIHARTAIGLDDAEIVRRTVAEIAEFVPEAAQARVRHAVVHRIPMAIACPLPGTEALRPDARTSLPQLWLAGDWTRTGLPSSMESAARSGAIAAEHAAAFFGRTLRAVLPLPRAQGVAAWVSPRRPPR
jgi:15-cis-phytoene desaturase